MTNSRFSALVSATARAMAAVRTEHCPAPDFRPAADVQDSMPCPKCSGLLTYTASAINGRTAGRCSSLGCVSWREL